MLHWRIFNANSTDAVIYESARTFQFCSGSTGMTIVSRAGEFTLIFRAQVALSRNVARVTIQSSPHRAVSYALGGNCTLGDTGPGGGKVFYLLAGDFTCRPLRNANC